MKILKNSQLLPLQPYHSGTAAGYNPVYDLPASPHSKSTKQACGYPTTRCASMWAAGRQQANKPRAGVRARARSFETATLRTATTRTTGPGTHDTHNAASTQMTDHTPRLTPATTGCADRTTSRRIASMCSRTQVRTHGSPARSISPLGTPLL